MQRTPIKKIMQPDGAMEFPLSKQLFCKCGSSIWIAWNSQCADKFIDDWREMHSGEGHGECTREVAAIALQGRIHDISFGLIVLPEDANAANAD